MDGRMDGQTLIIEKLHFKKVTLSNLTTAKMWSKRFKTTFWGEYCSPQKKNSPTFFLFFLKLKLKVDCLT